MHAEHVTYYGIRFVQPWIPETYRIQMRYVCNKPEYHTETTGRKWFFNLFVQSMTLTASWAVIVTTHTPHHTVLFSKKTGQAWCRVQTHHEQHNTSENFRKSSSFGDMFLNTLCRMLSKSTSTQWLALHVFTMDEMQKSVRNQGRLCNAEFQGQLTRGWSVMQIAV